MAYFEIQQNLYKNEWENIFAHEQDGSREPMKFLSYQAACDELDEYLYDCKEDVLDGYLIDMPNRNEFRIVEV